MVEIRSVLLRIAGTPRFHSYNDRAAERRVWQVAAFHGDDLRRKRAEQLRLVAVGMTADDALAARPSAVDHTAQIRVIGERIISLIDNERRLPFRDGSAGPLMSTLCN